jgi:hypothetical protein
VIAWGCGNDYSLINSNFGQCGVPTTAAQGVTAISAGYAHSLALKTPTLGLVFRNDP